MIPTHLQIDEYRPGSLRKLTGRGLLVVLELYSKVAIPKRFPLNFSRTVIF